MFYTLCSSVPPINDVLLFFFFNDTATTEIYTLSLHDALPISPEPRKARITTGMDQAWNSLSPFGSVTNRLRAERRSEEHTSELQSQSNLVCRLLLEKKKKKTSTITPQTRTTHD